MSPIFEPFLDDDVISTEIDSWLPMIEPMDDMHYDPTTI